MARAQKRVRIEQANPLLQKKNITNPIKNLKVCAYARVSTELEEQQSSYQAQVNYYREYIGKHEKWNFVDVYADEGISGTSVQKRAGFNKMIKMCKKGKIDIILTKSVSRFARNTVDSLMVCRDLKSLGIGVIFEKEGINTLRDDIELHLAIASSIAQEESRSISENVKWAFKRKFERGETMLVCSRFMGYDMDENGTLVINEEQAKVVKIIFKKFLEGYGFASIAKYLTDMHIKTVTGKSEWSGSTIKRMLMNEKYMGMVINQKTYTKDFLTHTRVKNNGEMPKYVVEESHEPIISQEDFEKVQRIIKKFHEGWNAQDTSNRKMNTGNILSNITVCNKCRDPYRRKIWKKRDGTRIVKYGCRKRLSTNSCDNEYIGENILKKMIVLGINEYRHSNDLEEYNELLVRKLINEIAVINKKEVDISFKSGTTIRIKI